MEGNLISGLTMNAQIIVNQFKHEDNKYYDDAFLNVFYNVHGKVYDERIQTFLKFDYLFHDLESAEVYYELIKKNFKDSLIKIQKETRQQIRCYN